MCSVLCSTKTKYDKIKEKEEEVETGKGQIYRHKSMPSHLVFGAVK